MEKWMLVVQFSDGSEPITMVSNDPDKLKNLGKLANSMLVLDGDVVVSNVMLGRENDKKELWFLDENGMWAKIPRSMMGSDYL